MFGIEWNGKFSQSAEKTEGTENRTITVPEESPSLGLDQIFEILKNRRRREVLRYLNEHGGTATLSELSEHIAALENNTTVRQITSEQRKRVYVGLYQAHLPKMDSMAVVEFEKNRGNIELGPAAPLLDQYLSQSSTKSAPPSLYAKLALGGFAAVVALGLLFPSSVLAVLVALGTLLTISAVSLHYSRDS